MTMVSHDVLRVVVMLSGEGTTLQALLDAAANYSYRVCGVVSDQHGARGLERAAHAGVPTALVEFSEYAGDRGAFDRALVDAVDGFSPDLVALAGFMRILGREFVANFYGRLVNIHPSLLPKYKGLDTYRRALAAGEREHGTTIHFVTEDLDGGPLIAQCIVTIETGDDPATLSARVQEIERRIYPEVLDWFGRGRISLRKKQVWLDGALLEAPVVRRRRASETKA